MPKGKTPPPARPTKPLPSQQRSQQSLERLLDAVEELLRKKDFDQISVTEIVRRAKSSVGVFYSRFEDKTEILFAVERREVETYIELAEQVLDPAHWREVPLAEIVERTVGVVVEHFRRRRHIARAVASCAAVQQKKLHTWSPFRDALVKAVTRIVADRPDEIRHPDATLAIQASLGMLFAFLDRLAVSEETPYGGLTLDDPRLEGEMARLLVRYSGLDR